MHLAGALLVFITVATQALCASQLPVALVQGTSSMPNDAERRYGVLVTQRLSRWLHEIPIPHTTLTDETLTLNTLRDVKVLILGYNPNPKPHTLATLEHYLNRGGKLIIFYASDPKLADMLGVRLGPYKGATGRHHWSGMQFGSNQNEGYPARIHQSSHSIRPVYPTSRNAQITALWEDERGTLTDLPAVVQSDRGTWVTHVLLDDGDAQSKKQLLLASVGRLLPAAWKAAASDALLQCGRVGTYTHPQQAWKNIHKKVTARTAPPSAAQHYQRATEYYRNAQSAISDNRFQDTVTLCQKGNQELIEALARTQPSRPGESRGVWDHSGLGLYPGDWNRTCKSLRANGITDLYVNLLWPGKAHYPSTIVPRSRTFQDYGDQAEACVKAGRKYGIRIHAWKVCLNLAGAPADFLLSLKKAGRLQVTKTGETIPWLCPSRADNIEYEVSAIRELARRYPFAGIHLDYIRYRDSSVCCCENCRRGVSRDTGMATTSWPEALRTPATRAAYDRWRCGRITHLVGETRKALRETAPTMQLSAAVFGRYPQCINSVAQDWHLWLQRDYVDVVCPMNYTPNLNAFRTWLSAQAALPGTEGRILPGIGVTTKDSNLDPIQVIEQIREVRRMGMSGYLLFDLNQTLASETLPALSLGITAE